jgi:hypothetical protein
MDSSPWTSEWGLGGSLVRESTMESYLPGEKEHLNRAHKWLVAKVLGKWGQHGREHL